MRALTRAHRRDVSTSSADITKRGGFLKRAEPGKIANLALRAPTYSFLPEALRGLSPVDVDAPAEPLVDFGTSFIPMWERSPARRETWTLCSGASSSLGWMPIWRATVRSWV